MRSRGAAGARDHESLYLGLADRGAVIDPHCGGGLAIELKRPDTRHLDSTHAGITRRRLETRDLRAWFGIHAAG
jgi:hypothetical protein